MRRSTAWKDAERRAAALVGGKRHIRNGYEQAPDVDGGRFNVECKWRQKLPVFLSKAMAQAEKFSSPDRPPLVVIFERGKHHGLVVLRTDAFKALLDAAQRPLDVEAAPAPLVAP